MAFLLPAYRPLTSLDEEKAWANALFVFDTNVLLNLYRYRTETSNALLATLRKVEERLWVPHHVALEFSRRRASVIVEQHSMFDKVKQVARTESGRFIESIRNLVPEGRHSTIDVSAFHKQVEDATKSLIDELDTLAEKQLKVDGPDSILDALDALFKGRVGSPPTEGSLTATYEEGEKRYKAKVPPGFRDADKDKEGEADEYTSEGLTYKRRFGDLLIWHQVLGHCAAAGKRSVVFVTDDSKSDWWLRIDGKTLGPRPELVDEARGRGKLDSFLMYTSPGFLNKANTFLQANVEDAALEDVVDVLERRTSAILPKDEVENAVRNWLARAAPPGVSCMSLSGTTMLGRGNKLVFVRIKRMKEWASVRQVLFRVLEGKRAKSPLVVVLVFKHINEALLGEQVVEDIKALLDGITVITGFTVATLDGLTFQPVLGPGTDDPFVVVTAD